MEQSGQVLILMKGHPGCAKSTVSRALARSLCCPLVDKDDIRDATLRFEGPDRSAPPAPTALNTLSYDIMWRIVETQLQIGLSVVVDCPLARISLFQVGSGLAQQYGCKLLIVECVATDLDEWKRRLEARAKTARVPCFEDNMRCMRCKESSSQCSIGLDKAVDASSCDGDHDFCRESSELESRKCYHVESSMDVDRFPSESGADTSVEAIGFKETKATRLWHKPSLWDDIEQLLLGYAKCYEYDTGSIKKLVVDTTSLSTEAAVSGILNWLRNLDENRIEVVSSLP